MCAAHSVPIKLLHDFVNDRVAKLRMLKPMLTFRSLKVAESNTDEQFPRLLAFAAELTGQSCSFAQQKNQPRVVVRLVHRKCSATGNRGAIFLLAPDRLSPFATREQPQLLPPNTEAFSQQYRRHLRHIAERFRTERGE